MRNARRFLAVPAAFLLIALPFSSTSFALRVGAGLEEPNSPVRAALENHLRSETAVPKPPFFVPSAGAEEGEAITGTNRSDVTPKLQLNGILIGPDGRKIKISELNGDEVFGVQLESPYAEVFLRIRQLSRNGYRYLPPQAPSNSDFKPSDEWPFDFDAGAEEEIGRILSQWAIPDRINPDAPITVISHALVKGLSDCFKVLGGILSQDDNRAIRQVLIDRHLFLVTDDPRLRSLFPHSSGLLEDVQQFISSSARPIYYEKEWTEPVPPVLSGAISSLGLSSDMQRGPVKRAQMRRLLASLAARVLRAGEKGKFENLFEEDASRAATVLEALLPYRLSGAGAEEGQLITGSSRRDLYPQLFVDGVLISPSGERLRIIKIDGNVVTAGGIGGSYAIVGLSTFSISDGALRGYRYVQAGGQPRKKSPAESYWDMAYGDGGEGAGTEERLGRTLGSREQLRWLGKGIEERASVEQAGVAFLYEPELIPGEGTIEQLLFLGEIEGNVSHELNLRESLSVELGLYSETAEKQLAARGIRVIRVSRAEDTFGQLSAAAVFVSAADAYYSGLSLFYLNPLDRRYTDLDEMRYPDVVVTFQKLTQSA